MEARREGSGVTAMEKTKERLELLGIIAELEVERKELRQAMRNLSGKYNALSAEVCNANARSAMKAAQRRLPWVECPECESTSIRCHMCGFVSDGPAFLHEEGPS